MSAQIIDISRGPGRRDAAGSSASATSTSAAAPAKSYSSTPTFPISAPGERQLWRAVVRVGSQFAAAREGDRVEWHMAGCAAPTAAGDHCNEGMHLIETVGHPDGHCLVNGTCERCEASAAQDGRQAA